MQRLQELRIVGHDIELAKAGVDLLAGLPALTHLALFNVRCNHLDWLHAQPE